MENLNFFSQACKYDPVYLEIALWKGKSGNEGTTAIFEMREVDTRREKTGKRGL
jgi:hypothetical protein